MEDPEGPLRPRQRLGAAGSRHDLDAQGYYTATINTKGKAIDFVFHDKDTDGWENPKDGGNYHANVGITHVA